MISKLASICYTLRNAQILLKTLLRKFKGIAAREIEFFSPGNQINFLFDRLLLKFFFCSFIAQELKYKLLSCIYEITYFFRKFLVTLSTDPPVGFRKPPMSLEPVSTVLKIVSVNHL
jgi:hypothetical protein